MQTSLCIVECFCSQRRKALFIAGKHMFILVWHGRVRDGDGYNKRQSRAVLQGTHWSREFFGAFFGKWKSSRATVQNRDTHCFTDSGTSLQCGSEFAFKYESEFARVTTIFFGRYLHCALRCPRPVILSSLHSSARHQISFTMMHDEST